jgi:MFS family permease
MTEATQSETDRGTTGQGHITGYGTPAYRAYVLNALLIIYTLSFMDRALLSVVGRPLKAEFQITDFWYGMLTGAGFAFVFATLGIPLARLSEKRSRVWIIAIALAVWSGFTAATGLSQEVTVGGFVITGFMFLLACRIGVGVGEAGANPPSSSIIADYFPAKSRSTALGYWAMGVTLGTMLANMIGGPIADAYGWRMAFFALGIPGILIAVIFVMTIREPPRGYSEPPEAKRGPALSFSAVLKVLAARPSFWMMTAGATIASFCGYAIAGFQSLYIQRTFDLTAGEASLWINAPAYAAGAVGTLLTGWLAQMIGSKSVSAIAWLPAIGLIVCVPFYIWGFTSPSLWICLAGLCLGHFVKYGYLASQFTIAQGVVPPSGRATATAILIFVINILGYGFGPPFAGFLSDFFFSRAAAEAGYAGMTNGVCDAAQEALKKAGEGVAKADVLAGLVRPMSEAQHAFCGVANSEATQSALLTISAIYALGGICFLLCLFTIRRDMTPRPVS